MSEEVGAPIKAGTLRWSSLITLLNGRDLSFYENPMIVSLSSIFPKEIIELTYD